MGLFQRISDIITANLSDYADRFEDPEKMLRLAIREMEQSIAEATTETAKVLANEKLLAKQLADHRRQAEEWGKKASNAVDSGDDQLARKALSRKQEHKKLAEAIEVEHKAASETAQTLKVQLEGMRAKLQEANRNLATLSARMRAADFKRKMASTEPSSVDVSTDNAFAKFERMREKVERAEAEAEALSELRSPGTAAADDESMKSHDDDDVEKELQRMKRAAK
jgi:phage shock protein A